MSGLRSTSHNQGGTGPDPFTYQGLNTDADLVLSGSEPSGNWRIRDLFYIPNGN